MVWSGKTSLELAKNEALNSGISNSNIYVHHSTGTRGDAYATKALMSLLGLKSAMVISDPLNMRRLSMIFRNIFAKSGFELTYIPINQRKGPFNYWWQSSYSFVYVIKEWIKLPINFFILLTDSSKKEKVFYDENPFVYVIKDWIRLLINFFVDSSEKEKDKQSYDLKSFKRIPKDFPEEPRDQYAAPIDRHSDGMIRKLTRKAILTVGRFLVLNQNGNGTDVAITAKISKKSAPLLQKRRL